MTEDEEDRIRKARALHPYFQLLFGLWSASLLVAIVGQAISEEQACGWSR